jgi:hypothetical protein
MIDTVTWVRPLLVIADVAVASGTHHIDRLCAPDSFACKLTWQGGAPDTVKRVAFGEDRFSI